MENKMCRQCGAGFVVEDDDLTFLKKVSPEFAGKKYLIPPPNNCPECRLQRRLSFRNIHDVYKRKSDLSGMDLVSHYAPNSKHKVYHLDEFKKYDAVENGRDFDFDQPFFEQLHDLWREVPKAHLSIDPDRIENADFINGARDVKNAYMCFSVTGSEDVYYSEFIHDSKNCMDCFKVGECELCYECVGCSGLYGSFYCLECENGQNLKFCRDLVGCQDCFGCVGLRNKQYYVFNKQYSKEEYIKFIN
ncbi:hypothetical protein KJ855_04755, partial [Patescibacteria group bacterium]|nr:hypothetical protein [Patescibacteria group bacterium]